MATLLFETDALTEKRLPEFAATLSEKDWRRFTAIEAKQRGYGGITYIAELLGCSTKTVERGIVDREQLSDDPAAGRVRRLGAGCKKDCIRIRGRRKPDRLSGGQDGWRS